MRPCLPIGSPGDPWAVCETCVIRNCDVPNPSSRNGTDWELYVRPPFWISSEARWWGDHHTSASTRAHSYSRAEREGFSSSSTTETHQKIYIVFLFFRVSLVRQAECGLFVLLPVALGSDIRNIFALSVLVLRAISRAVCRCPSPSLPSARARSVGYRFGSD